MLGSVVAKIIRGEEVVLKDPKKKGSKEFEEEFGLTKNDEYFINLFGFSKENVKDSQGYIIKSIAYWKMLKSAASKADDQYAYGIGKSIIEVVTSSANVYWFAAASKNQFNSNLYGVKWESKMAISNCAICDHHFKSFSLRQTMSKHHCRCCGRVVCFNCAPEKVVLARTGKHERICIQCIKSGGIPPPECIAINQSSSLKNFALKTGKAALSATAGELLDDDHEDLDESDADEDT
jgi:hypothetical protein